MDHDLAVETGAMRRLEAVKKVSDVGDSDIQKFYEGAVVLITGATGFLGKHLIEKLIRSCNLKKLYLLVRPKTDITAQQRLAEIFDDQVFEDLREKHPNYLGNIHVLDGDISELGLGLSEGDRQRVTAEVDIIVHSAAMVHFAAPLKIATIINVRGTREMIFLAKECTRLRCFVHVSTAYTHATFGRIGKHVLEEFYPSPMVPPRLIELAETTEAVVIDSITKCLLKDWPNTYTFTKAVGEELLRTMADGLPICIVRPTSILGAYTEPSPGWISRSALYGPTGLCHGIKMGLIHLLPGDGQISIDFIPVDCVTNTVIASAWEMARRRAEGLKDIKIYTVCSTRNIIKWATASKTLFDNANGVSPQAMWYSTAYNVNNRVVYLILHWLLHTIPAYSIDFISKLFGRKPKLVKLYTKIAKLADVMRYFMIHEWLFCDANTQALYKKMSPTDQVVFNIDVLDIDWVEMMRLWPIGLRKFILKDGLKDTQLARRKQFLYRIISYVFLGVYFYVFWLILTLLKMIIL